MVLNVHERRLAAPAARAGALIDSLAGQDDRLWPHERWPAMRFDRPLQVGAEGGHGPVRYRVEHYRPGTRVRFRFRAPAGFDGYHEYEVRPLGDGGCLLRHSLVMSARPRAWLTWPLVFRPLHDALLEDSLDKAERSLGAGPRPPRRWSVRVRLLRSLASAVSR
ncbi:SRPBCC family protein [Nonomuraea pusilla]|uniref:SRPBCC family protein n=1 Tax=Nonomuraea pusilla TaxID=46177 RepID=UPI00332607D5